MQLIYRTKLGKKKFGNMENQETLSLNHDSNMWDHSDFHHRNSHNVSNTVLTENQAYSSYIRNSSERSSLERTTRQPRTNSLMVSPAPAKNIFFTDISNPYLFR